MKKHNERCIFENVWDVFDGSYFVSQLTDPGWPTFFKVGADEVWLCKTQEIGWCSEGPGEVIERLEHVTALLDDELNCTLTFEGESKTIKRGKEPVIHYWGR